MSSNSVRSVNHNSNSTVIPIITSNHVEVSKKHLFRRPKTVQEKILCYTLCFLFITMMVFMAALCIISERWKMTLSKLSSFYFNEDMVCETEDCKETAQKLLSNLDPTTDPCEDFYQYACGGWMENNPIPNGRRSFKAFSIRVREVAAIIVDLLEGISPELEIPRAVAALRRLYHGCMDIGHKYGKDARNKSGVEPVVKLLQDMGGWPMVEGNEWNRENYLWYKQVAECSRKLFLDVIIKVSFSLNIDDNSFYTILLRRGDYLFDGLYDEVLFDPTSNTTQDLLDSIAQTAILLGSNMEVEDLREEARKLILFEYGLYTVGNGTRRLFEGSIKELDENATLNLERYSSFSYKELINLHLQSDVPATDDTIVYVTPFDHFLDLPGYIDEVDPRIVANYIGYWIVSEFAPYTVQELWSLIFEDTTDWYSSKACISILETFLPNAIYRLYIDKHFTPLTKYHMNKMIEMIRLAYSSTFDQRSWMDQKTMFSAVRKLQNMVSTVGYPPWITDNRQLDAYYEKALDIKEDDFFGAILQLCIVASDNYFSSWNKTVERNNTVRFKTTEVNAFYAPRVNYMAIPAGILGFPFYKYNRIDSVNYGAIGSVIGHEISHAFDARGRRYDHEGNLRNWWTKKTMKTFLSKARCFAEQYENFEFDPDVKVDGNFTLSENIADNGGVRNAFKAFRLHLALADEDKTNRKTLPGLSATPEQLFFLGYASIWCGNATTEHMQYLAEHDSHSPNKLRVNVPLGNFKEFARAFKCKPGTPMNPSQKCVLW